MAISEADIKILWGRAAGLCSRCKADLTVIIETGGAFNVGEMAHVIAHSSGGPRGVAGGGADGYDNLILLCPTCHRTIDKAPPGQFTESMIKAWKAEHEKEIRSRGIARKFATENELKSAISDKLAENRELWSKLGPQSDVAQNDPGSNLAAAWRLRKLDTILPNNNEIINMIETNRTLISKDEFTTFLAFKTHARAFEQHQYHRTDAYPLFPVEFEKVFG